MFYQEVIEYGGEPVKAILPDGVYCLTTIANDVPVTHQMVAEVLGLFRMIVGEDRSRRNCMTMKFKTNDLNTTQFIGEQLIIFDILGTMFDNSNDAEASVFHIETTQTDERIVITVSDDGKGIPPSVEEKVLRSVVTTKSNGLACNLFLASKMMQKIGGTLAYKGKGLDGKGACFELTFLKEMPSAN